MTRPWLSLVSSCGTRDTGLADSGRSSRWPRPVQQTRHPAGGTGGAGLPDINGCRGRAGERTQGPPPPPPPPSPALAKAAFTDWAPPLAGVVVAHGRVSRPPPSSPGSAPLPCHPNALTPPQVPALVWFCPLSHCPGPLLRLCPLFLRTGHPLKPKPEPGVLWG